MRVKHYYNFGKDTNRKIGNALTQSAWELLRIKEKNKDFSFVENNKDEYAKMCMEKDNYRNAAKLLLHVIKDNNMPKNIVSLGCGKGVLEWHLKNLDPQLHITCTDYTNIERLRELFPDCDDMYELDMRNEEGYKIIADNDSLVLCYRVSAEFSSKIWKEIFGKMHRGGVKCILFVPAEICTLNIAWREYKNHLLNVKSSVFCGYMYSKRAYKKMWKSYYSVKFEIPMDGTTIFCLERV